MEIKLVDKYYSKVSAEGITIRNPLHPDEEFIFGRDTTSGVWGSSEKMILKTVPGLSEIFSRIAHGRICELSAKRGPTGGVAYPTIQVRANGDLLWSDHPLIGSSPAASFVALVDPDATQLEVDEFTNIMYRGLDKSPGLMDDIDDFCLVDTSEEFLAGSSFSFATLVTYDPRLNMIGVPDQFNLGQIVNQEYLAKALLHYSTLTKADIAVSIIGSKDVKDYNQSFASDQFVDRFIDKLGD